MSDHPKTETAKDEDVDILTEGNIAEVLRNAFDSGPEDSEDVEITEAFVTDEDDTIHSAADILTGMTHRGMKHFGERTLSQHDAMEADKRETDTLQRLSARLAANKAVVQKTAKGTTQQSNELGHNSFIGDVSMIEIVEPPYPPELLSAFLEVDEVHYRCVRTKVTDSVGRDFQLVPSVTVKPDEDSARDDNGREVRPKDIDAKATPIPVQSNGAGIDFTLDGDPTQSLRNSEDNVDLTQKRHSFKSFMAKAASLITGGNAGAGNTAGSRSKQTNRKRIVTQEEVDNEVQMIEDFIEDANEVLGFEGVIDRACMDYEAIGWGAIEVIRSMDMKVRRIAHAPAIRMKVMKGWKGFVEVISNDRADGGTVHGGKYIYYQPFGNKITSLRKNSITNEYEPFDTKIDGEPGPKTARWNLIDRESGKPTNDISRAANEIIWIPRHHSNTIYYGYTDVVPALGWLLANVHIRDYLLQYFEHNTVPRYAIIIEGAKMAEPVKKAISAYFSSHVKGKAHKTLIIPVPSMRGEVKIRFEKLDADANEASFQETKKNNAQSIMTAHGVSPAIIGISESSELGSGKGLSQAEIYKDRIVTPSQRYWARKINRLFSRGLGANLVLIKFNPLDIRDEQAEMLVLTGYLQQGCTTINAIRKRAGLGDPIPGGDRPFMVLGQTIMFVDEMTEAMGTEREKLEEEIENTQFQLQQQAVQHKAERIAASVKGMAEKGAQNGQKPKPAGSAPAKGSGQTNGGSAKKPTKIGGG